jgi:uncharacterized Zn finger protein
MKHVFACRCGCEEEVEREVFSAGYVYQCPSCQKIWACVRMRMGPKVWIEVQKETADFYRLLEEPEDEDEE